MYRSGANYYNNTIRHMWSHRIIDSLNAPIHNTTILIPGWCILQLLNLTPSADLRRYNSKELEVNKPKPPFPTIGITWCFGTNNKFMRPLEMAHSLMGLVTHSLDRPITREGYDSDQISKTCGFPFKTAPNMFQSRPWFALPIF